jgi:hypothetical protein
MMISRQLVDYLLNIFAETYQDCVVKGNGDKAIYLIVQSTRHGLLVASLMFHWTFDWPLT